MTVAIDDRRGAFAQLAIVDLRVQTLEPVWVVCLWLRFQTGVSLFEFQASSAPDLIDSLLEGIFLHVGARVHVQDDVALPGGVEENVGRAVVVHARIDQVDARGIFNPGGPWPVWRNGCEVVHEVVLVARV